MIQKQKFLLCIILILLITITYAQEQQAGVTPDSFFYGADVFFDNARAAATLSPLGKSKVRLETMQERVAEMEEMAEKNKTVEANRARSEAQKQLQNFEDSTENIKKKDASKLKEQIQMHTEKLEIWKQRLMKYNISEYSDAIAEALVLLETTENVIVNIPEDLGPESTFIISSICKEAGATTVEECNEMISSGALTAQVRRIPEGRVDPHGCSGHYSSYAEQKKWCCDDSDGTYSQEWIEMRESEGRHGILDYYYRKGTVEYKIINLKTNEIEQGTETDSCDGNTLTEWFCPRVLDMVTRNERYSEEYECPYECEYGACIKEIIEEEISEKLPEIEGMEWKEGVEWKCTDSDDGQDYLVKGTVTISYTSEPTNVTASHIRRLNQMNISYTPESTTKFYYRTDYCFDGVQLIEVSCVTNNQFSISIHSCPHGCQRGSCIAEK